MAKKVRKSSSLVSKSSVASNKKSSGVTSGTKMPASAKQSVTRGLIARGQRAAAVASGKRAIANMKINATKAEAIIEMARKGRWPSEELNNMLKTLGETSNPTAEKTTAKKA